MPKAGKNIATIKEQKPHEFKKSSRPQFTSDFKSEKSIVQVIATSQTPDYEEGQPWAGAKIRKGSGSGFIITHEDKKYIVTNAHVVENSTMIRVRLANDSKKYDATRKIVSYQCDLALLEVSDPEFNKLAEPVELGEMVNYKQPIVLAGFPLGGSEISVASGVVERIEVDEYEMSHMDLLQVMVSAPINPGNSGGPIFSEDYRVVGVAFQGYGRPGLEYMIPIPIIKHFLQETFSGKPYEGFPILPIEVQVFENEDLKKAYHLQPGQSGVRIVKVQNEFSDTFNKLKSDDILLEIDGLKISGEGTVDIPGIGKRVDFNHVTHMKFVNDPDNNTVKLKVLRHNTESKEPQILDVIVKMDYIPLQYSKVPPAEHDKMPTYFVNSGISYMPLTRNYLEGRGSDLEECFLIEENDYLANVSKKFLDEQIVVINEILDCPETQSYDYNVNAIVAEINGKKIRNIRDVVTAIESNKDEFNTIITTAKNVIVVKNMKKERNEELLKLYHIPSDRSIDLMDSPYAPGLGLESPVKPSQQLKSNSSSLSSLTSPASLFKTPSEVSPSPLPKLSRKIDESEREDKDEAIDEKLINELAPMFKGRQTFLNKIAQLEERYKEEASSDADYVDFSIPENESPENERDEMEAKADEDEEMEEAAEIEEAKEVNEVDEAAEAKEVAALEAQKEKAAKLLEAQKVQQAKLVEAKLIAEKDTPPTHKYETRSSAKRQALQLFGKRKTEESEEQIVSAKRSKVF